MTNQDVRNIVNFWMNKSSYSNAVNEDEFNDQLQWANYELFNEEKEKYEMSSIVTTTIMALKVEDAALAIDGSGQADIPANYGFGAVFRTSADEEIDIVTTQEYNIRLGDALTQPTTDDPVAMFIGSKVQFNPLASTTVKIIYLKKPTDPVYDYYYDGNDKVVYLAAGASHVLSGDEIGSTGQVAPTEVTSNTVEMDWRDEDKLRIAAKILQKCGVNLKSADLVQYSEMEQQKKNKV